MAFKHIQSMYKMERPNVMAFKYKVNVRSLSEKYVIYWYEL